MFDRMHAEELIDWLRNSLSSVPLSEDVRAFLSVFANRLLLEKQ